MNTLYPIFLKPSNLNMLIIGGGKTCAEKIHFIKKNSPDIKIKLIAKEIKDSTLRYLKMYEKSIDYKIKSFEEDDLRESNIVVAATNNPIVNIEIYNLCKKNKILVNVADTPELCDFYLGSIVTKGDLKIAISTNGKSPTFAKRFRETLEELLPDSTSDLINNLNIIRNNINESFSKKVERLNEITKTLIQ